VVAVKVTFASEQIAPDGVAEILTLIGTFLLTTKYEALLEILLPQSYEM